MTESFNWLGRCARAAAFGIAALLLLTIARIVFFFAYKNDDLGFLRKLFKNPCSQAELNKIVPFGFSLQRQKMVFFCH